MSVNTEIIDNLFSLPGVEIDNADADKFAEVLQDLLLQLSHFSSAIEVATVAVQQFTTKIVDKLDKFYRLPQSLNILLPKTQAQNDTPSPSGDNSQAATSSVTELPKKTKGLSELIKRIVNTADPYSKIAPLQRLINQISENGMPFLDKWQEKINKVLAKMLTVPPLSWVKSPKTDGDKEKNDAEKRTTPAGSLWNYMKQQLGNAMRRLGLSHDSEQQKPTKNTPKTTSGRKKSVQSTPPATSYRYTVEKDASYSDSYLPLPVVNRPQPTPQGELLLTRMQPLFNKLEVMNHLPKGLLRSVAITESSGNLLAEGPQTKYDTAKGVFQFVDSTAKAFGLSGKDVFDPDKTLASYNWEIGNLERKGMGNMPNQTRNYIPRVRSNMPGGSPHLQQETNIYIQGVSDPREAARLTAEKQLSINSQTVQQLAGPR